MVEYLSSEYLHESVASLPDEAEALQQIINLPPKKRISVSYTFLRGNQENTLQRHNTIAEQEHGRRARTRSQDGHQEPNWITKPRPHYSRRPKNILPSWMCDPRSAIVPRCSRSLAIVPPPAGAIVYVGAGRQSDEDEDMYSRIKRRRRRTVREAELLRENEDRRRCMQMTTTVRAVINSGTGSMRGREPCLDTVDGKQTPTSFAGRDSSGLNGARYSSCGRPSSP